MQDRKDTPDQSVDMLINGVEQIADSLTGGSAETDLHGQDHSVRHDAPAGTAAVPDPSVEQQSAETARSDAEVSGETDPDKKKKKQPGLGPRWSYVITRGLVVALVWAFFAFAFDPILRFGAITAGQQTLQAKVDIDSLQTSFFPPKISMTDVAAANRNKPGTNIFEFAALDGDVDGLALMHGSYVIDKATVTGLTWNTPRDDDGLLPDSPAPDPSDGPGFGDQLEEFGKEWAKDLFERAQLEYDPRHLESVRLAQQLEVEWSSDFDGMETRIRQVDAKARQLKALIEQAKRGNAVDRIEAYRRAANDGARLISEVKVIRDDLKRLPGKAEGDLEDLDEARKRDQEEIKRKVQALVLDGDKLSEFLLGPTLHHRIRNTLAWLDWGRKRVDDFSGAPEPERQRGEKILFPIDNPLPDYLARLIEVTGNGKIGGDQMNVEGTILDVTSDPKVYGKPTIIRMAGHGDADVQMKAELDRTTDVSIDEVDLAYVLNQPVTNTLGDDDTLSVEVQAGSTTWNAHIEIIGDELTGTVALVQEPVVMTPEVKGDDETLSRLIASSMQNIDRIDATVQLSGTVRKPRFKLRTNLGETISEGVKQGVGNEVSAQKDALLAKLNSDLDVKQGELIGLFRGKYGDILQQLQLRETGIQDLIPKVAGRTFDPSKLFR